MRSENTARTDVIVPVKTRINQSAPLQTQKIIMILEGAFVKGAEFIGKALFTLNLENATIFQTLIMQASSTIAI
jgi:hypothetical protein